MLGKLAALGRNERRLHPEPLLAPPNADLMYYRQVRRLGDRGQEQLSKVNLAVIGAGGDGLPLVTMLARLEVGTLVVIDAGTVDLTSLNRLDVSRRSAMVPLRRWPS